MLIALPMKQVAILFAFGHSYNLKNLEKLAFLAFGEISFKFLLLFLIAHIYLF